MGLQAAMRAAAVSLLTDYGTDSGIKLNVYRARPRLITPPHAFVDAVGNSLDHNTNITRQSPTADVVVVHGIYDYGDSADQRDAFVDGFTAWAEDRFHAAGVNSLIAVSSVDDLLDWSPDWIATEARVFYATRITLEAYGPIGI